MGVGVGGWEAEMLGPLAGHRLASNCVVRARCEDLRRARGDLNERTRRKEKGKETK